MIRSQRQMAIFIALIGVMIVVYARALRPSTPQRSPATPATGTAQAGPAPKQESGIIPASDGQRMVLAMPERSTQREAQRQHATLLAWGRDPFTRGTATGDGSGLTLAGILWDPQQPLAIINGQTVHVGEELEGYRVTEITQDHVSITDGTQTFQLLIAP